MPIERVTPQQTVISTHDAVRKRVRSPAVPTSTVVKPAVVSATVRVRHKDTGAELELKEAVHQVDIPVGAKPYGNIGVGTKITWQPRQYESISVEVSIHMPCLPTFEAAKDMYLRCSDFVGRVTDHEIAIAKGEEAGVLDVSDLLITLVE